MVSPNPLTNLRQQIRDHWAWARPKMTARLAAAGRFEEAVETAAVLTEEAVLEFTDSGMSLLNAWDMVRQWWAILDTEADAPDLGSEPEHWVRPLIPDEDAPVSEA